MTEPEDLDEPNIDYLADLEELALGPLFSRDSDEQSSEPRERPAITLAQRYFLIVMLLADKGARGMQNTELAKAVGLTGTQSPSSAKDSLARDIRTLNGQGYEIQQVVGLGDNARYVLVPGDSRVRLSFTREQRAQLARAAARAQSLGLVAKIRADDEASGPDPEAGPGAVIQPPELPQGLDNVLRAVEKRCLLRFDFNGRSRVVEPERIFATKGEWTLAGRERPGSRPKVFAVRRMSDLRLDDPGSAPPVPSEGQVGADPLAWHMDEPLTAELEFQQRYAGDVGPLLGVSDLPDAGEDPDHILTISVRVTNRWIFCARVMELGERVRLVGGPEIQEDLAERLRAVRG